MLWVNFYVLDVRRRCINSLTPGWELFCKKCAFWTFWWFSGWISAKLALIWSKMHLQHESLPAFYNILAWACVEIKKGFLIFDFFFFAFPFSPFLFFLLQ